MDTSERIKAAIEDEASRRTPASGGALYGGGGPAPMDPANMANYSEQAGTSAQTPLRFGRGQYRVSQADQAAKSAAHHREMADLHQDAADFFAAHPEFEVFINLIRRGGISI